MSLAIAEADARASEALRFGFEREGVQVSLASAPDDVIGAARAPQVVVVGARAAAGSGLDFVSRLRSGAAGGPPVLFIGPAADRADALSAGAQQFLARPAYLRDAVTACRLLTGLRPGGRSFSGNLGEHRGLYYLVRALHALGFTGVMSLVRGLRRAELRFFAGEVTSASVGMLHGQAALHQLMLWTDARLDLRCEDVVRRQQIPLSPQDLLLDARRFVAELRAIAPWLSPSAVYRRQRDLTRLPIEIDPVVVLFDGHRTVADVIEDSPFRVFETLRIAVRLVRTGALDSVSREEGARPARAKTLDDWLVGAPSASAAPEDEDLDDWTPVLPSSDGAADSYASVVPAQSAGGEISVGALGDFEVAEVTSDTAPLPRVSRAAVRVGRGTATTGVLAGELEARVTTEPRVEPAGASTVVAEANGRAAPPKAGTLAEVADGWRGEEVVGRTLSKTRREALEDAADSVAAAATRAASAARTASDSDVEDSESPSTRAESDGGGVNGARRRPATDPGLAADAGRVAKSAANTARAAAAAFTADEEAFFAKGEAIAQSERAPVESFDDLEAVTGDEDNHAPPSKLAGLFRKRR